MFDGFILAKILSFVKKTFLFNFLFNFDLQIQKTSFSLHRLIQKKPFKVKRLGLVKKTLINLVDNKNEVFLQSLKIRENRLARSSRG